MLSIGDRPILWHIMKIYAKYGFKDFVLCLGYKGWVIKEFFLNYYSKTSDISFTLGEQDSIIYHNHNDEADWRVTLVDTGEESQTATRIWKSRRYLEGADYFSVTYGDGVADIDIRALLENHKKQGKLATVTGVQPLGRFGEMELDGNLIKEFNEKPNVSTGLINGGFMIFSQKALKKYFNGKNNPSLESDVIPRMVQNKQVGVYRHRGSWQCVDTPREYTKLNQLWAENKAFWKIWS